MTFYISPSALRTLRTGQRKLQWSFRPAEGRKRLRATDTSPASVLAHAREEAGL